MSHTRNEDFPIPPNAAAETGGGAPAPARILVADDNEDNRAVLTRRLERRGHGVTAVGDGLSALERARHGDLDLILLDLDMPGLSGLQVLRHLKGDGATADLPVIMISAHDEVEQVAEAIRAGAEDWLGKPFEPTLLDARIGVSLGRKRAMDSQRQALSALAESQRALAAELSDAAQYVRHLLPAAERSAVRADWHFLPSAQLGGDALGWQWVDGDHFAFHVLDVCGHGVASALHSISVLNILKGRLLPGIDFRDPSAVLACLNRQFAMESNHGLYFTLWYGVYSKTDRVLRWANGGHPPPLLWPGAGGTPQVLEVEGGPGIGIMAEGAWPSGERKMGPGDRLALFTDGIYERPRPDGRMGEYEDFLLALKEKGSDRVPSDVEMLGAMGQGAGSGPPEDDITLMTLVFD